MLVRSGLILLALAPAAACAQFSPLTITTSSLPNGSVSRSYNAQVSSNATTAGTWSIIGGSLPPGLSLSGSGPSATISGVPTATGTYSFMIEVDDPQLDSSASKSLSITILSSSALAFATPSPLPSAMEGVSYSQNISATGGTPGYNFSATGVPAGLTLTANGILFGKPAARSTYTIIITVVDQAQNSTTMSFLLTVTPPLQLVTTSPLPSGTATGAYTQTFVATGGTLGYTFGITDTPPPGLTMSPGGILNGTATSVGTFTFTVQVIDQLNFSVTGKYQVTFAAPAALLQVSPASLSFISAIGGNSPPPQSLSIASTNATVVAYTITIDGGSSTAPAPTWLTVSPTAGNVPARITVTASPGQFGGGTYKATIHVGVSKNTTQSPIDIPVSYVIAGGTPLLQTIPQSLAFGAHATTPGIQQQTVVVTNGGGGGPLNFSAQIVNRSPWITGVTPGFGTTAPNSPVFVQIQINSLGLAIGVYHDILRFLATGSSIDIPVTLFVAQEGPILSVSVTGVRFQVRQGGGSLRPQNIQVLNLGTSSTTANWTADLLSGSDWLNITTPTGTATPGQPGNLTLTPNSNAVASFPAGPRYALVRVSDPNAQSSPQYVAAVLDDQPITTPPLPDPSPAGLFFTSSSLSKQVLVYTSTATQIGFQASASTNDGAPWLSVTPTSGVSSTSNPGQVSVSVNPTNLTLGIYTGNINISMSGVVRVVNVTLVVVPSGFSPSGFQAHATGCTPGALAITETGLVNNFAVPAGWPATLVVQLNDNCGNSVPSGSVVASFSNGDPPLSLRGDQATNTYSATWQPGVVLPQMTIALRGTSGSLQPATAQLIGAINGNSASPPSLLPDGTLHIFFNGATAAALGAGLAPGNVAQVYGTALAPSLTGSATVPLQTQIAGTFMLIGGIQAPMFFVSQSPIAVQIPAELTPNRQYSAIVSANGALSLPITVDVVPLQPGMAANPDGSVIAQRPADYSLVTSSKPAHPGEALVIYLAGMGPTNPSVPSGAPSPLPLIPVTTPATITLDGQKCDILYAGLTLGGVGLYQINFTVPSNPRSGNLNLVVTQNGITSNTTTLPVSN